MSALFDFPALIVVLLLFICATTFARSLYPTVFDTGSSVDPNAIGGMRGTIGSSVEHSGLRGLCWKASRVGERLSPYVAGACLLMALQVLFFKA